MKKTVWIPVLIVLITYSCITTKTVTHTLHVKDADSLLPSGFIYSVPQTSLKIYVELLKVETIRGPYYQYADKYLNIQNVPEENKIEWFITNVVITCYEEPDPDHFYYVYAENGTIENSKLEELGNKGLIINYANWRAKEEIQSIEIKPSIKRGPVYTDLSVKRNLDLRIDTLYKTILNDSSFIRVPVFREQLIKKSIEEKAEEAADFIIKLRKRRFKLMAGQYDFYPSGEALKTGVKELDELEDEYLSLFTGKVFQETYHFEYEYTPITGEVFENVELFEFSKNEGILYNDRGDGTMVSLMIRKMNKTAGVEELSKNIPDTRKTDQLFYRIPDMAEVEIMEGGKSLLRRKIYIYQYGPVVTMPFTSE